MPALLIMGGISAASSIIGGIGKKKAADEAGKIQSAAADKVAGINRGVYQQQMSGMEPYAALGRQNVNTLSRLLQPGVPYTPQMQLQDARSQQVQRPSWSMTPGEPASQPPGFMNSTSVFARPFQQAYQRSTLGNLAQSSVPLRGPDGSVRAIPAAQVEDFLRRGAVRV